LISAFRKTTQEVELVETVDFFGTVFIFANLNLKRFRNDRIKLFFRIEYFFILKCRINNFLNNFLLEFDLKADTKVDGSGLLRSPYISNKSVIFNNREIKNNSSKHKKLLRMPKPIDQIRTEKYAELHDLIKQKVADKISEWKSSIQNTGSNYSTIQSEANPDSVNSEPEENELIEIS
jgi:hypothetical protein